jgi:hypothetical protein
MRKTQLISVFTHSDSGDDIDVDQTTSTRIETAVQTTIMTSLNETYSGKRCGSTSPTQRRRTMGRDHLVVTHINAITILLVTTNSQ